MPPSDWWRWSAGRAVPVGTVRRRPRRSVSQEGSHAGLPTGWLRQCVCDRHGGDPRHSRVLASADLGSLTGCAGRVDGSRAAGDGLGDRVQRADHERRRAQHRGDEHHAVRSAADRRCIARHRRGRCDLLRDGRLLCARDRDDIPGSFPRPRPVAVAAACAKRSATLRMDSATSPGTAHCA